jgi:hypothetical protein
LTTAQITFGVKPFPQRRRGPPLIRADRIQASTAALTQSGTGIVTNVPAFAGQAGNYPVALAKLQVLQSQSRQLCPSQTAADEDCQHGAIPAFSRTGIASAGQ